MKTTLGGGSAAAAGGGRDHHRGQRGAVTIEVSRGISSLREGAVVHRVVTHTGVGTSGRVDTGFPPASRVAHADTLNHDPPPCAPRFPVTMLASLKLAKRVLLETDKRLLWKLVYNMGFKGALSVHKHKRRHAAAASSSRRSCTSRSSTPATSAARGAGSTWHASSRRSRPTPSTSWSAKRRQMGNVFFGIVGGEPFMHPHLLDMLAEHPDCYFQIFTNGHFITPERARRMWQLGNVTPLVSVEGTEIVSDERRGRAGRAEQDDAGPAQRPRRRRLHRRLHQPRPHEHRRHAEGRVDRPAHRDGRAVHVVPRLPADGAEPEPGPVPDAGAGAASAEVRGRDAGEEADRHHRRLPRRRGQGALPGRERHQPPHQPVGRHRAVPDRAVLEGVDPRDRGRTRARSRRSSSSRRSWPTSASSRPRRPAAASCSSGRTC